MKARNTKLLRKKTHQLSSIKLMGKTFDTGELY